MRLAPEQGTSWMKAYAGSAEKRKEMEDWEGRSPSVGQGSCCHSYPAVTTAPKCSRPFFSPWKP